MGSMSKINTCDEDINHLRQYLSWFDFRKYLCTRSNQENREIYQPEKIRLGEIVGNFINRSAKLQANDPRHRVCECSFAL